MTDETVDTEVNEAVAETLTDLFNDDKEEAPAETKAEAETESEKGEETKPETVETKAEETEDKTEEKEAEPVEKPSTESVGLQAALVAERQKRQKAEAELKKLQEPEKIPDVIEDPEGYAKYLEGKNDTTAQKTKIDLSRSIVLSMKDDYLEKEGVFMGLIGDIEDGKLVEITDQSLYEKFLASDNPALFAYDYAAKHQQVEKLSDPKYLEELIQERAAKIVAEQSVDTGVKAEQVPDLTTAPAAGSNGVEPEKLVDLDDMFEENAVL